MSKLFLVLGSLNGFFAVALGAFGAHGLKARLTPDLLSIYETGVQYHTTHALGLLAIGIVAHWLPDSTLLRWAGWLFFVGIVLFSGSLYLLSITGVRSWGAVAPFGGTAFLIGWVLFAFAALRA